MLDYKSKSIKQTLKNHVVILSFFIATFWLVEILDFIGNDWLEIYGVRPREISGLYGIIFAPFLHGSFFHLASNTIPFLILGWIVLIRGTFKFVTVYIISMLTSGLGIWFIGNSNSVHIGVSGIIFGFFGYILFSAWFEKSLKSIIFSIIVIVLYGGFIIGIIPGNAGVSWEGHLFGFLGGILSAKLLANYKK
ncbi:MAG: rhomboid family intramembrane serine protease [Clostridiales bacterium]